MAVELPVITDNREDNTFGNALRLLPPNAGARDARGDERGSNG